MDCVLALALTVSGASARAEDDCEGDLQPSSDFFRAKIEAFRTIDQNFEKAFPELKADDLASMQVLRKYILVGDRFLSKRLVVVFIGAENMGKSTTVAALGPMLSGRNDVRHGDYVTKPFHSGGATLRPVIVMSPRSLDDESIADIRARYGDVDFDQDPEAALRPGKPLVRFVEGLKEYQEFIFVDAPDFTSGEVGATPANLQAARVALLPGDLIYVMVDDRNSKNQAVQQILHDNFKMFGARRTAWIMRSGAFYQDHPELAVEALTKTARQAYFGQEADKHPTGVPSDVSGMFLMPEDPEVARSKVHPAYIPIGTTLEFSGLLDEHQKNWADIKDRAIKSATRKLHEDLGGAVLSEGRAKLVAEVYLAALKAVGRKIARTSTLDFPYDQNKQYWRRAFAKTGKLAWLDNFLENTVGLYQKIPYFVSTADDVLKMNEDLQSAALTKATDQARTFLSELDRGRITLDAGDGLSDLLEVLNTYITKFGGKELQVEAETLKGSKLGTLGEAMADKDILRMTFNLPNAAYLKERVRTAWSSTVKRAPILVASEMVTRPPTEKEEAAIRSLENAGRELKQDEKDRLRDLKTNYRAKLKMISIDEGMVDARKKMSAVDKTLAGANDAPVPGGVIAATIAFIKSVAIGLASGGGGLVAVVVTGAVGRWNKDRVTNKTLKPLINEWFKATQEKELSAAFEEQVMKEYGDAMTESKEQADAFWKIVGALGVLGKP